MEETKTPKLPSHSILYLMLCGGGVLAFILLAILPYKQALGRMDKDIQDITAQINEQKVLQPIFKDLLNQLKAESPQGLPSTPKSKLGRNDADKWAAIFQKMARSSHLRLNNFTPDLNTFVDNTGVFKVTLIVSGDFLDIRPFFLKLIQIPYLEHIEQVAVRTSENIKEANFMIWMTQES